MLQAEAESNVSILENVLFQIQIRGSCVVKLNKCVF